MGVLEKLNLAKEKGEIPEKVYLVFHDLFTTYSKSLPAEYKEKEIDEQIFSVYLEKVKEEVISPHPFAPYHERVTSPFDYYTFGLEFIRHILDFKKSAVLGVENLDKIDQDLKNGDNVVLFANHQTEIDPQILSAMVEKTHPKIAEEIIFVAGDRVVTDPMAIPFSLGRNLLCIYSKRHIDHPPEKKVEKQLHNQKTMRRMKELLNEGGRCIYVAPSGGRDRRNKEGQVTVAPFDPNNVEMFRLMSSGLDRKTHFYTLSLLTYDILPPPADIESEIGEMRAAYHAPVFLSFGPELAIDSLFKEIPDRHERRAKVSEHIWKLIYDENLRLLKRKTNS